MMVFRTLLKWVKHLHLHLTIKQTLNYIMVITLNLTPFFSLVSPSGKFLSYVQEAGI